MTDKMMGQCEI